MSELAIVRPGRGIHFLIECGEEEVLQDSLVVCALLRIGEIEDLIQSSIIEQLVRHQPFFLDEPYEDQAGDQANDTGGITGVFVLACAAGERNIPDRPEIPVGNLAEETLVELGAVEGPLPGVVEFHKIGEPVSFP